jgi:ADP-heptose:LPS heptosyltransferase
MPIEAVRAPLAPPKPLSRILLVRPDRLGDLLMNLPLIHRLKTAYPRASLTLVCARAWAPLFHHHLDVNRVIGMDLNGRPGPLIRELVRGKFDCAVITAPSKAWHLAAFRMGIRVRAGFDRKWGFLLTHRTPDRKAESGRHEVDINLEVADRLCPAPWNGRMDLGLDMHPHRAEITGSLGLIPGRRHIVFHLTSSNAQKEIPSSVFAGVFSKLLEKPRHQIIVVGADAGPYAPMLKVFEGEPCFTDLTGRTDITKLALLLREARCVVSTDSGPFHLAWVQKTPTVALFVEGAPGSTPERWGVYPGFAPNRTLRARQLEFDPAAIHAAVLNILEEVPDER